MREALDLHMRGLGSAGDLWRHEASFRDGWDEAMKFVARFIEMRSRTQSVTPTDFTTSNATLTQLRLRRDLGGSKVRDLIMEMHISGARDATDTWEEDLRR